MKKYIKIIPLFLVVTFLFLQGSAASEEVGPVKKRWRKFLSDLKKPAEGKVPATVKTALDKLTEKEILKRIKYMLETSPEIMDFIPELKELDLETLDKGSLIKIHNRINIERIRIQTDRIQKQLEVIRASESIPKPPQEYTAPLIPKTPAPPQSPPKVPKEPPSPPEEPSSRR